MWVGGGGGRGEVVGSWCRGGCGFGHGRGCGRGRGRGCGHGCGWVDVHTCGCDGVCLFV